jgi:two-component system cell cycle response regulator
MNKLANYFNTDSLKGRLRYFILNLLLFVILAVTIFLIFMTKSQLNKTYNNELNAIVKLQSQSVEKWINERELDIKFLAAQPYVKAKKIKLFFESFVLNQSEFYSISYVNKEGHTLVESTFDTKNYFGKEKFFLDSLDGMDTISKVRISKDGKMPIIYFSSPVFDEYNEVTAIVIGAVRLSSIQNLVEDFRFSKTGETFIINKQNQLLTKRKFEDITILKEIDASYKRSGFYTNYSGDEVLGVTTNALFDRWTIVAQISTTEMYKVFKKFIVYISLFVVVLLIMIIPVILLFSNKIEKPLKSLLKGSKTIENGEYGHNINSESITHSTVEIRELTHSFNSMSNKLNNVIGELKLSSTVDVLSQLLNRRELMRLSILSYQKSKRENTTFAIFMIDIDFFKKINDNYGHRSGDVAISMVSNSIKTSLSASDIVGRYGGEEFLVFISNTDLLRAEEIAQRIRRNVEELVIRSEELIFNCTCSIGLFYKDTIDSAHSLEDVIELSDKALYKAKENGRNRVEIIIG